ncbi:ABC transporter ATP-binding protein [Lysinibacillus sp. NPDC093210]|uniref:ABC transporter ATP-binding protein n=1 Tax=Lysinibacillus sp. NPDC093210 TaxID=3364133 RepID=UPI00381CFA1B
MKKMIVVDNIVKSFGEGEKKHSVLNGVSVEINEGEFVAIMGPSGSGKSTLMYAVSGMDSIDTGKVFFDGMDLSILSEQELADLRRTKMGFVFQQPTLLKNLNIIDNIILPSMRDNRKSVDKITKKARSLMKKVGISDLEKRNITQVSGGQLQRAGICRALISNPKIIFGDEPTGALNSKSAQEIMDIITEINAEGTAVLLVTHDPKIAARTDRILFMRDGKIVDEIQFNRFTVTNNENKVEMILEEMRKNGI